MDVGRHRRTAGIYTNKTNKRIHIQKKREGRREKDRWMERSPAHLHERNATALKEKREGRWTGGERIERRRGRGDIEDAGQGCSLCVR